MWSKLRTDKEREAMEIAVMDLTAVENFQLKRNLHESKRATV